MANKNFETWLGSFKESIASYEYYVDFKKVIANADKYKVELNILNSLIGSSNIKQDFIDLVKKYPSVLNCIPTLIAVRSTEIVALDEGQELHYNFKNMNYSVEQYAVFMEKIGLFDLISKHIVNNLYDYVLGVETGLDSNARKNRGGHDMENLVASYLDKIKVPYRSEVYIGEITEKWGLDLSSISNKGDSEKRFDFVVESNGIIYGIEVNFYKSSGSKLNETARSYKMIAEEAKEIEGFKFVWITDGLGWKSAKHNLKETFDVLDDIYCIKELEDGVLKQVFGL